LDLSAKLLDFFILSFLFTQKERTKEKAPEMTTLACPGVCYTGLVGATGQSKVRAIWLRRTRSSWCGFAIRAWCSARFRFAYAS